MAAFLRVELEDGSVALFEAAESDLVSMYSGRPDVEDAEDATTERLEVVAWAAAAMAKRVRETVTPDEIALEVAVGLSGEVGWFSEVHSKQFREADFEVDAGTSGRGSGS